MRSFLICPVRNKPPELYAAIVSELESRGFSVHWPPRDTDQHDPSGFRICQDNARAIRDASVVHVVWDGHSQGCLFDLGVAFAYGKRVEPIELPPVTDGKSFQNMIRVWAANG